MFEVEWLGPRYWETKLRYDRPIDMISPMLRCGANHMNRWEIFPSLLIGTSIFKMAAAVSLLLLQINRFVLAT